MRRPLLSAAGHAASIAPFSVLQLRKRNFITSSLIQIYLVRQPFLRFRCLLIRLSQKILRAAQRKKFAWQQHNFMNRGRKNVKIILKLFSKSSKSFFFQQRHCAEIEFLIGICVELLIYLQQSARQARFHLTPRGLKHFFFAQREHFHNFMVDHSRVDLFVSGVDHRAADDRQIQKSSIRFILQIFPIFLVIDNLQYQIFFSDCRIVPPKARIPAEPCSRKQHAR